MSAELRTLKRRAGIAEEAVRVKKERLDEPEQETANSKNEKLTGELETANSQIEQLCKEHEENYNLLESSRKCYDKMSHSGCKFQDIAKMVMMILITIQMCQSQTLG
jgi:hypothetical protein